MISNLDLCNLMNASNDIFVLTEIGNDYFLMVNDKMVDVLGYSKFEILSNPYYKFIFYKDIEKTKIESEKINNSNIPYSFVNRYLSKDGKIVYLKWNSIKVGNKFYNFAKVEEDVDKMVLSTDNFSQLFENSGVVICIIDLERNFINVSPSGKNFWGYSKKEILSIKYDDIVYSSDIVMFNDNFLDLISKKNSNGYYQIKNRFVHRTGRIVHGVVDIVLTKAIDNSPAYVILQIQNITDLVIAEKKIERINKELVVKNKNLENFTYAASHDLKEPLRKILSFSSILKKQIDKYCRKCIIKQFVLENLESLFSASKRMEKLINDLLEYSRVGRANYKLEEVNLNSVIDDVVELFSFDIDEKNIDISVSEMPIIYSNYNILVRLMQNLIGNSIKFAKKDSQLFIKIYIFKKTQKYIVICVEDNGIGFDMIFADKIFKPFERLYGRDEYEGSGIGLALCKSIVEGFGGEIWAESERNSGTKIFIKIFKKERENK